MRESSARSGSRFYHRPRNTHQLRLQLGNQAFALRRQPDSITDAPGIGSNIDEPLRAQSAHQPRDRALGQLRSLRDLSLARGVVLLANQPLGSLEYLPARERHPPPEHPARLVAGTSTLDATIASPPPTDGPRTARRPPPGKPKAHTRALPNASAHPTRHPSTQTTCHPPLPEEGTSLLRIGGHSLDAANNREIPAAIVKPAANGHRAPHRPSRTPKVSSGSNSLKTCRWAERHVSSGSSSLKSQFGAELTRAGLEGSSSAKVGASRLREDANRRGRKPQAEGSSPSGGCDVMRSARQALRQRGLRLSSARAFRGRCRAS